MNSSSVSGINIIYQWKCLNTESVHNTKIISNHTTPPPPLKQKKSPINKPLSTGTQMLTSFSKLINIQAHWFKIFFKSNQLIVFNCNILF